MAAAAAPSLLARAGARVKDLFTGLVGGGGEGSWRGPFFGRGELGGWYQLAPLEDGYQRNLTLTGDGAGRIPAAYAAVMANARAVSQCYAAHKRTAADGVVSIVTTSAASRVLKKPNAVETWPQFVLNMVAAMQFEGAAFAVAQRNDRGEVSALWRLPRGVCSPYVAADGTVFYSIGANVLAPDLGDAMAPARDVLHLRAYTPRHPLLGESPIAAAALAAGINVALSASQAAFFSRMNRPSGVLKTAAALTAAQLQVLRGAFEEHSKAWAQGGMPILSNGLEFQALSINSQDAQLIEAQRLSIEDIARVFGVPLPVIGDLTHATLQNVESLVNMWLAVSLGALLENVERSLDDLFGLATGDYIELDTRALLRTDFLARVDGLTKGIQGGLFTPNEARAREGLSPAEKGDKPYLQQQMVPLGWEPPPPPPPPAPVPTAPPAPGADGAAPPPPDDPAAGKSARLEFLRGKLAPYKVAA